MLFGVIITFFTESFNDALKKINKKRRITRENLSLKPVTLSLQ